VRIAVAGDAPCDLAPVRRAIRAALRPLRLPRETEVAIAFVNDAQMRELNRRHRRIDRTTDVLSFGQKLPRGVRGAGAIPHLDADPDGVLRVGDIVISPAQAARQARRRRRPLEAEVAFLAAHGALHLVGYQDETPRGYREMLRLGHDALRQNSVKS
jgi:probable rRNA maturation factor